MAKRKQAETTAATPAFNVPAAAAVAIPPAGVAKNGVDGRRVTVRRVTVELPAVPIGDRLGPRHLDARLSLNARRALAAIVHGIDVGNEVDQAGHRPRNNSTSAAMNFVLERIWERLAG